MFSSFFLQYASDFYLGSTDTFLQTGSQEKKNAEWKLPALLDLGFTFWILLTYFWLLAILNIYLLAELCPLFQTAHLPSVGGRASFWEWYWAAIQDGIRFSDT